jgi:hypothetical protein
MVNISLKPKVTYIYSTKIELNKRAAVYLSIQNIQ